MGDGTTTNRLVPSAVAGSVAFVDIGVEGTSTCALATDGRMYCWGSNNLGQLGDGTTINRAQPTLVAGGLTFSAMAKGPAQACGIATSGAAYCWGFCDRIRC